MVRSQRTSDSVTSKDYAFSIKIPSMTRKYLNGKGHCAQHLHTQDGSAEGGVCKRKAWMVSKKNECRRARRNSYQRNSYRPAWRSLRYSLYLLKRIPSRSGGIIDAKLYDRSASRETEPAQVLENTRIPKCMQDDRKSGIIRYNYATRCTTETSDVSEQ